MHTKIGRLTITVGGILPIKSQVSHKIQRIQTRALQKILWKDTYIKAGFTTVLATLFLLLFGVFTLAKGEEIFLVSPRYCKHGVNAPAKGDFAAFIFCDDALGTQIGIILTRKGVGPVIDGADWSNINRFWQEGLWMTDVSEMVWSKTGNYLYVVTSEVYSDGNLYELDLHRRKATKLLEARNFETPLSINKISDDTLIVNDRKIPMKN